MALVSGVLPGSPTDGLTSEQAALRFRSWHHRFPGHTGKSFDRPACPTLPSETPVQHSMALPVPCGLPASSPNQGAFRRRFVSALAAQETRVSGSSSADPFGPASSRVSASPDVSLRQSPLAEDFFVMKHRSPFFPVWPTASIFRLRIQSLQIALKDFDRYAQMLLRASV